MNPQVRAIRDWFNQIYLGGIPLMINDETAFLFRLRPDCG
jgi:hypothetical protein